MDRGRNVKNGGIHSNKEGVFHLKANKAARAAAGGRRAVLFKRELPLHLMLIPAVILVLIYSYGPMILSIFVALQNFVPAKGIAGSGWVGLENFKKLFALPNFGQVVFNTVYISLWKMILGVVVPVLFALLLNEVSNRVFKKVFQTLVYMPNFLSWIIIAGILIDILSPSGGVVNKFLSQFKIEPIFFLGDPKWFPTTIVVSDIWQRFGFGTVVYLAALTGIDPTLYEAAEIDGANRWAQTLHVTLPALKGMIVLMTVLSMGNILNAGFDQIFNLYSPQVYSTGDILDTLIYRLSMENAQFSLGTAAGLFKSAISFVFVVLSYYLADKFADYRVF